MASKPERSGWFIPIGVLMGGLLAGAVFALSFVALHSNWKRLAWVTPDAESTAPFWVFEGLIPIVVSVGWTALILHARDRPRWLALSAALAALEIALLAFALIPIARSGNGGVWAANIGLPALALVLLAGPIASIAWPIRRRLVNVWPHVVAGLLLPVAINVSYTSTTPVFAG